jgi:predicted unusual protein kinase regulating ubiquinone biosynthesis (AarF/ABC1/UbiB family)
MNVIKQLWFLFKVFFIFSSEYLFLFFHADKLKFIDRLTQRLANVNILYVKVFQAIALNNSLIDENINNMLLKFTDNAPWTRDDIDVDTLNALKEDQQLVICDGVYNPINSGMISLVFKATRISDDSNVIIKIKRRMIERKLKDAIDNLMFFMYVLSFFPFVKKFQLAEIVNKNIDIIKHQINFDEEVENLLKIKNNCKHLKYVKIPAVFKEVTNKYPNVILMEQIDGVPINKVKEEDYEEFAKSILKFGFVTTLLHGVTHGDLHSGNILFIKDDNDKKYKHKIGVLDFGIVYEIDSQFKGVLFSVLTEMFNDPTEVTVKKLLYSGLIEPLELVKSLADVHRNHIIKVSSEMLHDAIHNSQCANQIQLYKFLVEFKKYISNPEISGLGLRPSDDFVKTQLVLAMAHGVTLTLCKDDYMTFANKVINELFHTDIMM